MTLLYATLVVLCSLWALGGLLAIAWTRLRPRPRSASERPGRAVEPLLEPVTVLKPLCGVDAELENNLRTFFEQSHPCYELVFGVQGTDDPAIDVVRRLQREYPWVRCQLVVHHGGRALNPKVDNLRAMLEAASHDLLVVNDSNVAVGPGYLREMATEIARPGVGLVTNLFAGAGERTLGATLESLQLSSTIAPGIALPTEVLGHPVVVGKSMMFRRTVLERLGGLESVASVLAEDYVIGRMFHAAGYDVRLCSTPIANVCADTSVKGFVHRHVRWGMIRIRMQPFAYVLEPLTMPLVVGLLAPLFGVGAGWPLVWAVVTTLVRDAGSWLSLRGPKGLAAALPLFPVRDVLMLLAWVRAPLRRHVSWRGQRVRVSAGTRLYAEHERAPVRTRLAEG